MFGRTQGINFGGIPKLLAPEISLGGNFSYDINGGKIKLPHQYIERRL